MTVNLPTIAPWTGLFSASDTPAVINANDGKQVEVGVKFTSSVAGSITGIEFYRATGDTGTDIADLWSSTGTLLATGTFSNTSAFGWQPVTFSSPVAITAGTTYVASYHSTGAYADTTNYFATAYTNGSLTAPARCRRLRLRRYQHHRHLPDQHLPGQQLLRRCRLQQWRSQLASGGQCRQRLLTPENTPLTITTSSLLANDTDRKAIRCP